MSGAVLALIASIGVLTDWHDINAHLAGENNDVAITAAATVTASIAPNSGVTQVYYVKNGGSQVTYSGAFTVAPGDTLRWGVQTKSTDSFVATVKFNGVTVDTFQVNLT